MPNFLTKYNRIMIVIFVVLLTIPFFINIVKEKKISELSAKEGTYDLNHIKKRGKIVALTDYNSTSYFIYKGQPMGYQFELLQLLADHLDVELEIEINNDIENSINALNAGIVDIIALDLTITNERKKRIEFTDAYSQTRQVLVQRKPENWVNMHYSTIEDSLIRNPLDLGGKTVYIQKNSSFKIRLLNLMEEIADTIYIIEEEIEAEQLIGKVADGEINYTVCDEHVALVNQVYYDDIDVHTAISFPQKLAWAVRHNSDSLIININGWLADIKDSRKFKNIYTKYFTNKRSIHMVQNEYHSIRGGKISKYDKEIRRYSAQINWDWLLLASLIYQESRFNHSVVSWAGAFGLMQLMPSTASTYGVGSSSPPGDNIAAGVKFIKWLDKQLPKEINDSNERVKFVLASYNIGLGHILDARNLAKKYGRNPNVWFDNVEYFLLQKANPKYYRDPIVKSGYCRGIETKNFVKEIIDRYKHYETVFGK